MIWNNYSLVFAKICLYKNAIDVSNKNLTLLQTAGCHLWWIDASVPGKSKREKMVIQIELWKNAKKERGIWNVLTKWKNTRKTG